MWISLAFAVVFGLIIFALLRNAVGIVGGVGTAIFSYLVLYLGLPTLAFGFYGIPVLVMIVGVAAIVFGAMSNEMNADKSGSISLMGGAGITGIGLLTAIVFPLLLTPVSMNNAGNYQQILSAGEVEDGGTFDSDMAVIDPTQIRMVDQDLAKTLAETKLGEDAGLGSRVEIGPMRIQSVGGKLFWVGPLEWDGPFKWAFGDAGTPGYMVVSAYNQRDVRLVKDVDGQPLSLKIGEGAYMWDHLHRYIWNNGFAATPYTDFTFEVDDKWRPYWVMTRYERTVGYSGNVANGVIIVDPQTREITEYDMDKIPEWVDRVQPESFIKDQVDDWGEWVHGLWGNFEGKDKLNHTRGISIVYGSDGRAKWYTGIQSVGADQGTTGFMLIDTRTGKAKYYRQSGITEWACRKNIRGLVAEKTGWTITDCILYNVGGDPTYIAVIKDADGNPKEVGIASVVSRDVVVKHVRIAGALRAYRSSLRSKGNVAGADTGIDTLLAKGMVVRFGSEVLDGQTYFYMFIDTEPTKVFSAAAGLNSAELTVTQVGDIVEIRYDDAGRAIVDMIAFKNTALNLRRSDVEAAVQKDAAAD